MVGEYISWHFLVYLTEENVSVKQEGDTDAKVMTNSLSCLPQRLITRSSRVAALAEVRRCWGDRESKTEGEGGGEGGYTK